MLRKLFLYQIIEVSFLRYFILNIYIGVFSILRMYFKAWDGNFSQLFPTLFAKYPGFSQWIWTMSLLCAVAPCSYRSSSVGGTDSSTPLRCCSCCRLTSSTLFGAHRTRSPFLFLKNFLPIFVQLFLYLLCNDFSNPLALFQLYCCSQILNMS